MRPYHNKLEAETQSKYRYMLCKFCRYWHALDFYIFTYSVFTCSEECLIGGLLGITILVCQVEICSLAEANAEARSHIALLLYEWVRIELRCRFNGIATMYISRTYVEAR